MTRLISLFALSLLLVLSGCEKDDNGSASGGGNGNGGGGGGNTGEKTFTATVNNNAFSASSELFIGSTYTNVSGIHAWGVSGIRTNLSNSEVINVVINSLDSTDFAVGTVFSGLNTPFDSFSAGTYTIEENGTQINAESFEDATLPATCTITAINTDAKTWSATFMFEAEGDNGQTYIITEGEFTNVSYE